MNPVGKSTFRVGHLRRCGIFEGACETVQDLQHVLRELCNIAKPTVGCLG